MAFHMAKIWELQVGLSYAFLSAVLRRQVPSCLSCKFLFLSCKFLFLS
jgi:hypothetical protein